MEQSYPDASVTIACGPLATTLFEGAPNVERIIPLKKKKWNGHWVGLWKTVIGTRWDIVVDLRDSAVSRLVRADERYIYGKHIDSSKHKVEQNAAVMKLSTLPAPKLHYTPAQNEKAATLIPDGAPVLGVGPTSNWIGKTWPAERFIETIHWMRAESGVIPGARVAVFAAPGEELAAQQVFDSLPDGAHLDLIAKTDPGTAAAALARCDFYLGNDSGLMHCAAAAGVPTFGVFGPSYPHLYAPWGENAAYARTPETFDELIDFEGYSTQTCGCLMETLSVEDVKAGIVAFMKKREAA
jgi:heptosyltransferase-3